MQLNGNVGLRLALLLGLAVGLAGCPTLHYPKIQSDFQEAVRIDNGTSVQPFTDSSTDELFEDIVRRLSDESIAKLDRRLRPNAWLLRSYSAWRAGDLKDARSSASKGLDAGPADGSRDSVVLTLMPALVIDSEIRERWRADGKVVEPAAYQSYERDFATALQKLDAAERQKTAATPLSALYYLQYQRWRILQNWRQVIGTIPERTERNDARSSAELKLGGVKLKAAGEKARDAIPPGHQLRALIAAQELQ
jgi:hypothetical protein